MKTAFVRRLFAASTFRLVLLSSFCLRDAFNFAFTTPLNVLALSANLLNTMAPLNITAKIAKILRISNVVLSYMGNAKMSRRAGCSAR